MTFEEDILIAAYRLHQSLMTKGELHKRKDPELYRLYSDPEIREVLHRVFLPVDQAIIVKVEEKLYFVPEVHNDAYSFTNEELRKEVKLATNKEVYLTQFIWMNVISEFYGEQFLLTGETRSFIKVDEILNKVKDLMGKFKKLPEEDRMDLAVQYELDIPGMLDVWDNLHEVTDKVKDLSKSDKKDYGFILKGLRFLENENLIVVKEQEEIVMTEKMKSIVGQYYHQETRINEIKKLLNDIGERERREIYA
ncbi:DUF6063 family protein [Neobacillus sp. OS1-33]|uniref:DUF6063 family protein n=1 Tax=Neobacillus sp. OS1-33 TaxID=3070683 RepID=UPI0027E17ECE|nr:DUF6063 family protein [Neobacillus sp. OS1-33]WML26323.1 DUF6063 family protein [Neobacillus sp. OS1-33]